MKNDRGSTLIIVILLFSILMIFGVAFGTNMFFEANHSILQQKRIQAHYIAKAGAVATDKWIRAMDEEDLSEFAGLEFPIDSHEETFGEGRFQVNIQKQDGKLIIKSEGKVEHGKDAAGNTKYVTETVTLVLSETENPVPEIDMAVFSEGHIEMRGNKAEIIGNIGTNSNEAGAIDLHSAGSVDGDIYIPSGSDPEVVNIQNETRIRYLTEKRTYPSPVLPEFPNNLTNRGNITIKKEEDSKTLYYNGYYSDITLENGTLRIDASSGDKEIRIGYFDMKSGNIEVIGEGKVSFYIDRLGGIKGDINKGGKTEQVGIYCKGEDTLKINANNEINGSIYLEEASVEIGGNSSITGDIITAGESIDLGGNTSVVPKVIYAPNANVVVGGNGTVEGAIIGKDVLIKGSSIVKMTEPSIELKLPVEVEGVNKGYEKGYWK